MKLELFIDDGGVYLSIPADQGILNLVSLQKHGIWRNGFWTEWARQQIEGLGLSDHRIADENNS